MIRAIRKFCCACSMYLKIQVCYCALIGFSIIVFYYAYNEYSDIPKVQQHYSNDSKSNQTKYILYWIPFWSRKDYYLGHGFTPFQNCEYKNCYATSDKNLLPIEKYDALIFHGIHEKARIKIPSVRRSHQYYIYMNVEAPVYICPNLKPYNSFFNLTMTYRFDSDIVRRHGIVVENKTNYVLPSKELIGKKTKLAAWFASNCHTSSKREVLVNAIKKNAQIDVYGRCGSLKCQHSKSSSKLSSDECYDMVERDYKFYLSFENSYCTDYSTEKLYNILKRNIVPVVYGAGNYKLSAPPNSVINVADFDSVVELVDYLKLLDKNDEKYLEYFKWKKDFTIATSDITTACAICQKLNEQKQLVYDDLYTWWWGVDKNKCKVNKNLPKIVSNLL